ncbi:smoothelin-like protein 1 isoform X2 [Hydractinia symbiolongicarpus]|uniref:smoothelin-like protein 1 isoform X2 n=1 Tax=Hydractinia symbiolongicarpus TaxID=13093 RepID=UPI00254CF400|nr:smoothelin-like protein 1 isoform X2 [Hydractinia symbiolongicarpus]
MILVRFLGGTNLELADSLEERKELRSQLREVRKKLFEGPTISTTKPAEKKINTNVEIENAKNSKLEINNNDTAKTGEKMASSMSIKISSNSRAFDTNNNSMPAKAGFTIGDDMSTNDINGSATATVQPKTRNALDRAERRSRRAAHMKALVKESSIDVAAGKATTVEVKNNEIKKTEAKTETKINSFQKASTDRSVVTEAKKNAAPFSVSRSQENKFGEKVTLSSRTSTPALNVQEGSPSGLRRTATWSTNRTTPSKNIGNTLNISKKFGSQAGPSPFTFGISYDKKDAKIETTAAPASQKFSFNKYTPTISTTHKKWEAQTVNKAPISTVGYGAKKCTPSEVVLGHVGSPLNTSNSSPALGNFGSKIESKPASEVDSTKTELKNISPNMLHSSKSSTNFVENVRNSSLNEQGVGGLKEHNQGTSATKFSVSGLRRAASMKVRPTYENSTSREAFDKNTRQHTPSPLAKNFERSQSSFDRPTSALSNERAMSTRSYKKDSPPRSTGLNMTGLRSVSSVKEAKTSSYRSAEQQQYTSSSANTNGIAPTSTVAYTTQSSSPSNDRSESPFASNRLSIGSNFQRSVSPRASPRSSPRASPSIQRRNEPARPAAEAPDLKKQSVADRMAFFRQAQDQEKKAIEKQKAQEEQRKRLSSAPTEEPKNEDKKEDEKPEKKEEKTEKKEEKEEPEVKDSEKMKYAAPCMKKREKKKVVRRTMSIGSIVLDWVQEMIRDYPVEVKNFSASWNDGMAFCALIHKFNPDAFDFSELKPENKRYNFDLAFNTGLKVKNIPILLDTEDMVMLAKPEPRSVQTYIQWIWSVYGPTSGYGPTPKEVQS